MQRPVQFGKTTAWLLAACLSLGVAARALAAGADFQGATHMVPFDDDTIGYGKKLATGAIARLQEQIDRGEAQLAFDERLGYLPAVLGALKVPADSQVLVFSKTSFQREKISPRTPRALYYNDDVYVGFVAGSSLLELSMADPKLGGVFYTLEQKPARKPQFVRNDQCLECHASVKSMGVPGHLLRSFATDEEGIVDLNSGTSLVSHRTPFAERWGGWFVTGDAGGQSHRGNLFGKAAFAEHEKNPTYRGSLTDLSNFFDTRPYLKTSSDIVSLMVLEHQVHMHNFITRLHDDSTIYLAQYGNVKYTKNAVEAFLRYLLFTEEAPLTATVRGSREFQAEFEKMGPMDKKGRSLRQLDLQTKLFKYPCSYLIYSEAFDSLPQPLLEHIYQRLWDILSGNDNNPEFACIPAESKRAVREILVATKKGLPDYWKF